MDKEFNVNAAKQKAQEHLDQSQTNVGNDIAQTLLVACDEIDRLKKLLSQMEHQMSRMVFDPRELGWD